MKNLCLIIMVCFIIPKITFCQLSVGGGLTYAQSYEKAGVQLRGMYQINKRLRPSIDYAYYIGSRVVRNSEFNINLHYLFLDHSKFSIYGLAGLNVFTNKVKSTTQNESNTIMGLNVGVGTNFNISKNLSGIVEVKHTFGKYVNQWRPSVGLVRKF